MSHVLIVDDEPSICWGFREFLADDGHDVSIASSAEEAFRIVADCRPDTVFLDIRLPGIDGLSAMKRLRETIGNVPIVVMTAFGNLETAVRAVKEGAFDYLPKPFDLDQAGELVQRAIEARQPVDVAATSATSAAGRTAAHTLVGSSAAMQRVFKQIALVSTSDVPVLIMGESGTGKELVARAVHRNSLRQEAAFFPVCLPALSPGVVESELFGHVKGAFTGADMDRTGILESAGGGTVLLDEIGDTTRELQVKLLRALEQQEIARVGDARPRLIDVRIIAATNRQLHELMASGDFREDLFFRLSVFQIHLPALRERREDIPELATHFLQSSRVPGCDPRLSDDVLAELQSRTWTGNVRELRNVMEHAAIVSRGEPIRLTHLPAPMPSSGESSSDDDDLLRQRITDWARIQAQATLESAAEGTVHERFLQIVEPPLLEAVLAHCENNRAAASQLLGIHRTTFRQKLRRYGIEVE